MPHARIEMLNLLGDEVDQWARLAHDPDSRLHLYGKRVAQSGRKMGHVNKLRPL
jgi:5-(carboxyamino)imidazole ribonucleotide synthase